MPGKGSSGAMLEFDNYALVLSQVVTDLRIVTRSRREDRAVGKWPSGATEYGS